MIKISMQYFGGNGASSKKAGAGGARTAGMDEIIARQNAVAAERMRTLQNDYDKASVEDKIKMLKSHKEADPGNGVNEALWSHAIAEATPVEITSESSRGMYIKASREFVKDNYALASQTDAVFNNTGTSSSVYRGSKGNLYIQTVSNNGVPGGKLEYTLRRIKK